MWFMLLVMLAVGTVLLRVVPPRRPLSESQAQRHEAEAILRSSTTVTERGRFELLSRQLPAPFAGRPDVALSDLASRTCSESVSARSIRAVSHGLRDLCLIDFEDGRSLRLTVFDHRNARRFASAWRDDQTRKLRFRWIEGVGWQCLLLDSIRSLDRGGAGTASVAAVYGWTAEVEMLRS